jgi:hypothetical protein
MLKIMGGLQIINLNVFLQKLKIKGRMLNSKKAEERDF